MRLHTRLALPIFILGLAVSGAGVLGVISLVRNTFGTALEQQGIHLGEIVENVLKGRTLGLDGIARDLAIDPPAFTERAAEVKSASGLVLAAIADTKTGRQEAAFGPSLNADDVRNLPGKSQPSPLLLRSSSGLLICGTAKLPGARQVIVAQPVGKGFLDALQGLLRAHVILRIPEGIIESSDDKQTILKSHPVNLEFATPGDAKVTFTILIPAEKALAAKEAAIAISIAGGLILLAVAFAFYNYVILKVTKPIRNLTSAAERIASGDLESRLPTDAPAELGDLMKQFNRMAQAVKAARDKLVHSAKLSSVGQLVASISHELNNPLLGLLGHAEYLASKLKPGDLGHEEVSIVLEEGRRMKKRLAELRGFVRPGDSERADFDLNMVISEVLSLVRRQAQRNRIELKTQLPEGGILVTAAVDEIRQVLLNLVLNGIESMPEGGTLTITAEKLPDGVRIRVCDTGRGVSTENLKRLFEPFFSTQPGRMGLGLAICKDIVTKHGGSIEIESQQGKGTDVLLGLPVRQA